MLDMFEVKARSQTVKNKVLYRLCAVWQVFWFVLSIEFDYGVVYAVRDHFQQVTVKVRSLLGQRGSDLDVNACPQKGALLV